jgi:hypothetical protein
MKKLDIDDLLIGLVNKDENYNRFVDYVDVIGLLKSVEEFYIKDKIEYLQNLRNKINPYNIEGGLIKLDIEIELYELNKILDGNT